MGFAEDIKRLRMKAILTQEEFAKEIGVSFATVNRWETGKAKPTIKAKQKQTELLDAGKDQNKIDEIGDAIMTLREKRQTILTEAAMRKDVQDRIEDLASFLDEQVEAVTEYSDALVRRLIEKITVCDENLIVEFKSGLEVEVDA